jgi:hypothetical protein
MRYLVLFIFPFLFFSCTKRLDLDLPYEDKLVVNAFLDDENGLTFNLTKTLNPVGNYGENLDNKITDAQVFLIENFTTQYPLQHIDKGNYELIDTNFIPQEGKTYSIKVIHPKYSVVTSKSIVYPKKFNLNELKIEPHTIDNKPSEFNVISFSLKDYDNSDVNILFTINDTLQNRYYKYELKLSLNPDYNNIKNDCDINLRQNVKVIPQDCFKNQTFNYFFEVAEYNPPKVFIFDLMYTNIEFIEYVKSLDNFDPFNASFVVLFEGTMLKPTYTNINNGWGIFYCKRIISTML